VDAGTHVNPRADLDAGPDLDSRPDNNTTAHFHPGSADINACSSANFGSCSGLHI
jgi:hypothetical protein